MTGPRVLLVSKPVVPPWNDSGKNIVRDVARFGSRYTYHVMTTRGAEPPGTDCVAEAVYGDAGSYSPGVAQNLRVLLRLLRPDGAAIHHYFFAPNPRTSAVARLVTALRRRPTVQTVSSSPLTYEGVARLCFGDRVVALSAYNRRMLEGAGVGGVVHVPPGIPVPALREDRAEVRALHGLPLDRPVILFAGDYQYSSAATVLAEAIPRVLAGRAAHFVYACRIKQEASRIVEGRVREAIRAAGVAADVTFLHEVDDMEGLIAASDLSTMPAESLYAKMDLPLVLLECLAQQVPLVVADVEPLVEVLGGRDDWGVAVPPKDPVALATALGRLLDAPERLRVMGEAGRQAVFARWSAQVMAAAYEDIYDEVRR
ncbi:MAG: hypothetical protein AMXMBFR64_01280 [Myxococcales bacterium]